MYKPYPPTEPPPLETTKRFVLREHDILSSEETLCVKDFPAGTEDVELYVSPCDPDDEISITVTYVKHVPLTEREQLVTNVRHSVALTEYNKQLRTYHQELAVYDEWEEVEQRRQYEELKKKFESQ